MPLSNNLSLPSTELNESYLTLDNFKKGVITLIDDSRLPKNALKAADNLILVEDGQPTVRPGVDWYGTAPTFYSTGTASQSGVTVTGVGTTFTAAMVGMTIVFSNGKTAIIGAYTSATLLTVDTSQTVSSTTYVINAPIQGFDYFDADGVIHLVMVAGGKIYRSLDDGTTWTVCTGYTVTAGSSVYFNQYNSYLYITNGVDDITLYDGTTILVRYTVLSTPAAAAAVETSLAGTAYNYYYKIARVNTIGFSAASVVNTGTVSADLPRASWVSNVNYVTLTMPISIATQTRWDIYLSEDNVNFYYLASQATPTVPGIVTWVDNGTGIVVPSTIAPTADTSKGPLVTELTNVGSRMYGIRDTANPYRIWFSSGSTPKGAFSSAYDGGYIDWQEGGKYIPVKVEDYRDGKGTPLATVWCSSADGQGCILQVSLDVFTVGDISITLPSAYKLPGSRGTSSPGSVINVLNDYMFYNSQAFYNLGSRAQFLNLLSTDEASANIRPSIKRINNNAEDKICSVFDKAKVYFSVPYGTDDNSHVAIFDTERKAWLPKAFTRGFTRFVRYTDSGGEHRLLAYQTGDTKMSEISTSILGDYGAAFETLLTTGLYPVSKDRFQFQFVEEGEIELSNLQGLISLKLIGIDRQLGYSVIKSPTIDPISAEITTGWDTFSWDSSAWDDTSATIEVYSEPSVKRYFNVQKELNAIQWEITTATLGSNYVLRTLQTHGTDTLAGKPRDWRLST